MTFDKYPFLKELGLEQVNAGCYRDGEWVGHGEDYVTVNPHNNEPIAVIKQASK